ncbi:raptor N-terminal caspase like domain-containing protein [Gaertneriomyces semiglobifer]|nr:raptor N-terminal caspase like domain-containing protein [Gaertneriomyces semiglobifer]
MTQDAINSVTPDVQHIKAKYIANGQQEPTHAEDVTEPAELDSTFNYYTERRHSQSRSIWSNITQGTQEVADWRMKERLKTVSVALVLCLNIGVDPPDVLKTNPCATLECWVDPASLPPPKALESIGRNLQAQYEVWQPRARYRLSLDPSVDEIRKLCSSLRRNSKDERILFHYNGHGVPRPTYGGEIWAFNKNYTQYIPISIFDVQTWLGSPCIYVYDCSAAGNILNAFNRFAKQRESNRQKHPSDAEYAEVSSIGCIQLAACQANEVLPMSPSLPADVFTCCLTTPLEIALRWATTRNPLLESITPSMILQVPGRLNDRRTPLGELNWIFTAITDTIAWNTLPLNLFKKLFRQDLMVAALFRNFLLAQRIMRYYGCTPMSCPALPSTHDHHLWDSWDLAADACLSQLPLLLGSGEGDQPAAEYQHSVFFAEQLTAFEVWLSKDHPRDHRPEQLPIVLQVLLSQAHRLKAMMLLSRFLDIGSWAVNLALSVGIFPYVLKLLQSPAPELKPVLVFIWAKILAVDRSCQNDLLKDNGYMYFLGILASQANPPMVSNVSEHRAMCAFILSIFCTNFQAGQQACLEHHILETLAVHLDDRDPLLRQWTAICLSKAWDNYPDAKVGAIHLGIHEKLCELLLDPVPEVRSAVLDALRTLIAHHPDMESDVGVEQYVSTAILVSAGDASPLVRRQLVQTLGQIIADAPSKFVPVAAEMMNEPRRSVTMEQKNAFPPLPAASVTTNPRTTHMPVWKAVLTLTVDPFTGVSTAAQHIVDSIMMMSMTGDGDVTEDEYKATSVPGSVTANTVSAKELLKKLGGPKKALPPSAADIPELNSFFEWSSAYFVEPQMQIPEIEDPGSVIYHESAWRKRRNTALVVEDHDHTGEFGFGTTEDRTRNIATDGCQPTDVIFHPFDSYFAVTDGRQNVRLFNWEDNCEMQSISTREPVGSRVTSMSFMNDADLTMLVVACDTGTVRLYRDPQIPRSMSLVSAWRALPEVLNFGNRSSGTLVDWHQKTGTLVAGGDGHLLRIWSAEREMCLGVLPTRDKRDLGPASSLTSLSSEKEGWLITGGFDNGEVKVWDRRVSGASSVIASYQDLRFKVLSTRLLPEPVGGQLVAGSTDGTVKAWDMRQRHALHVINTSNEMRVNGLDIHPRLPVATCTDSLALHIHHWPTSQSTNIRLASLQAPISGYSSLRTHYGHFSPLGYGSLGYSSGQGGRGTVDVKFHPRLSLVGVVGTNSVVIYEGGGGRDRKLA